MDVEDLARRAAEDLRALGFPRTHLMSEEQWLLAMARVIARLVHDALDEHEDHYLHLPGNRP